jgi:hypothetical protein
MKRFLLAFVIAIICASSYQVAFAADNTYGNTADSLKAKQDLVVDFAGRMGIGDPTNAVAEFVGGVPVKINGQTVPSELYTDQQRSAIAVARSLADETQGVSQTGNTVSGSGSTVGGNSSSSGSNSAVTTTSGSGWSTGNVSNFGLPTGTVSSIIGAILEWLLALIGIVGIIGFIISGAMYILSVGDDTRAKTAKSAMMSSIIGIVVALSGFVIIQAVNSMLNSFTDF